MYPIIGLLILILDIYVIVQILNSTVDMGIKLVWIIVVLALPPLGAILYLLLGRGSSLT